MAEPRHVPCQEFVELITDYLEGVLDPETTTAVQHHLGLCPGCAEYVEQMKETLRVAGQLPADTLPQDVQDQIVAAFTGFHRPQE